MREVVGDNNELSQHSELVESKKIMPFWASINALNYQRRTIAIRVLGSRDDVKTNIPFSSPFWYNSEHTTLLKLKNNVKHTVL
jgi:hypothetical protein